MWGGAEVWCGADVGRGRGGVRPKCKVGREIGRDSAGMRGRATGLSGAGARSGSGVQGGAGAQDAAEPRSSVGRGPGGMRGGAGMRTERGRSAGRARPGYSKGRGRGAGRGEPPEPRSVLLRVCANFSHALVYAYSATSF